MKRTKIVGIVEVVFIIVVLTICPACQKKEKEQDTKAGVQNTPTANSMEETKPFTVQKSESPANIETPNLCDAVAVMGISPDDKTIAFRCSDHRVQFWDLTTGKPLSIIDENQIGEYFQFSPDGKTFITKSHDYSLWDVAAGKPLNLLQQGGIHNYSLAFSPTGKVIALGGGTLWDTVTGNALGRIPIGGVTSVVFSPDGKLIACGSHQKVSVFDAVSNKPISIHIGHTSQVDELAFSPDGKIIASMDYYKESLHLWDTDSGKLRAEINIKIHQGDFAFSPDGKSIAISENKAIRFFDTITGKPLDIKITVEDICMDFNTMDLIFSTDGSTITAVSREGIVRCWNTQNGEKISERLPDKKQYIYAVFSPNGKMIASIDAKSQNRQDNEKTVQIRDLSGKTLTELSGHKDDVTAAVFSPDSQTIATVSDDQTIRLWNTASGNPQNVIRWHTSPLSTVVFNSNGSIVASAGTDDRTIHIQDVNLQKPRTIIEGLANCIDKLTFSPDDKIIASIASIDGERIISIWDVAQGKHRFTLPIKDYMINSVTFSPDSRSLFLWSKSDTGYNIIIWDINKNNQHAILKNIAQEDEVMITSPDKKTIAFAFQDGTIGLWDVSGGNIRTTLTGHKKAVTTMAFSPDSKTIVTGAWKGSLRLWDVESGKCLAIFKGYNFSSISAAFNPTGNIIIVSTFYYGETEGYEKIEFLCYDPTKPEKPLFVSSWQNNVVSCQCNVVVSPKGKFFAVIPGSSGSGVEVYDSNTGQRVWAFKPGANSQQLYPIHRYYLTIFYLDFIAGNSLRFFNRMGHIN